MRLRQTLPGCERKAIVLENNISISKIPEQRVVGERGIFLAGYAQVFPIIHSCGETYPQGLCSDYAQIAERSQSMPDGTT